MKKDHVRTTNLIQQQMNVKRKTVDQNFKNADTKRILEIDV